MKYYLGQVNQFLAPKNKLEKAIQEYIKIFDRKLVKEAELEDYLTEIKENVKSISKAHSKCTPIDAHFWTPAQFNDEVKDQVLGGVDCVRFVFMCSKEVKQ